MPYKNLISGKGRKDIIEADVCIRSTAIEDCLICPICQKNVPITFDSDKVDMAFFGGKIHHTEFNCDNCGSKWESVPYWVPIYDGISLEDLRRNEAIGFGIRNNEINPSRFFLGSSYGVEDLKAWLQKENPYIMGSIIKRGTGALIQFKNDSDRHKTFQIFNDLKQDAELSYFVNPYYEGLIYIHGNFSRYNHLLAIPENVEYTYWEKTILYEKKPIFSESPAGSGNYTINYGDPSVRCCGKGRNLSDDEIYWKMVERVKDDFGVSNYKTITSLNDLRDCPSTIIDGVRTDVDEWLTSQIITDIEKGYCEIL